MKYYTFTELKEDMVITYEKGLRDRENSYIEATSYCYLVYELDLVCGLDEKILISLVIGKIMLKKTNRVFSGQYKLFEKAAKDTILKQNELDLTQEERIEVVKWANELLEKLPLMEIEHDPRAK